MYGSRGRSPKPKNPRSFLTLVLFDCLFANCIRLLWHAIVLTQRWSPGSQLWQGRLALVQGQLRREHVAFTEHEQQGSSRATGVFTRRFLFCCPLTDWDATTIPPQAALFDRFDFDWGVTPPASNWNGGGSCSSFVVCVESVRFFGVNLLAPKLDCMESSSEVSLSTDSCVAGISDVGCRTSAPKGTPPEISVGDITNDDGDGNASFAKTKTRQSTRMVIQVLSGGLESVYR